jgi:Tol biopolymer transport system component
MPAGCGEDTQIWEIPSKGGSPVQITKNGGLSSMESPDGKFLYFTKANAHGIWKMPVGGGAETLVMNRLNLESPGYWSMFGDGIHYLNDGTKPELEIDFYSFATRQSTRIVGLARQPDPWFGGLTVSPNRRWIVFSQREYSSSELILAENFR